MNNTTKINILAYASEPDKNYDSYEKCLEYVNKRRVNRVTKYEELIKKGNSQING